jgi:hypothetical protein
MITNFDLEEIAKKHNIPLNKIFMKDMPPMDIREGGYIINLQDKMSGQGGSHWVGLYIGSTKQKAIGYCDSFGFIPPQSVINWIKQSIFRKYPIYYNKKEIQNINSGGCGIYSMFFIDFISSHTNTTSIKKLVEKFGDIFSDDSLENLRILKKQVTYYKNSD